MYYQGLIPIDSVPKSSSLYLVANYFHNHANIMLNAGLVFKSSDFIERFRKTMSVLLMSLVTQIMYMKFLLLRFNLSPNQMLNTRRQTYRKRCIRKSALTQVKWRAKSSYLY